MGQHILNDDEYNEIKNREKTALDRCAELERDLVAAKRADPRVRDLEALARDLITVMRFAVANLPPETTRNWPRTELTMIATHLQALPSYGSDDETLAIELRAFVDSCIDADRKRAEKASKR